MSKLLLLLLLTACATKVAKTPIEDVPQDNIFSYKSSLAVIKKATQCANIVAHHKPFLDEIKAKTDFTYTDDPGQAIVDKMQSHRCVTRSYKTKNPWSKVYATTYKSNNIDIYLNMRKKRSVYSWAGTVHHECSHNYGYGHGGNDKSINWHLKKDSVPYWIGYKATEYAELLCQDI